MEKHWKSRLGRIGKQEYVGFPSKTKASPSFFSKAQVGSAWLSQTQGHRDTAMTSQSPSSAWSSIGEGWRNPSFRRLTDAELQQRRAKGMHFRCDEKFGLGHLYKNKELQVLLLLEDDPELEAENLESDLGNSNTTPPATSLDLSLHSLMGFTSSHTMKVKGLLGTREVIILIDSGASHSFIATKLVHELNLPCEVTTGVGVVVGNGISFK